MRSPANDLPHQDATVAFVTAFASTLKHLTIYPSHHPRVSAQIDDLLARQATDWPLGCELSLLHDQVRVREQVIEATHTAVGWLLQRARDAGLARIVITPECRREHVVTFALALIAARPGVANDASVPWPGPTAPLRPVMLLVGDRHAGDGRTPPGDSDGQADPFGNIAPELAARLRDVAEAPEVRRLLDTVAATCQQANPAGDLVGRDLHLMGSIGELLPAELPNDITALTELVVRVLSNLTRNLERMRHRRQLRNANMLQVTINVARKFFAREVALADADRQLPSGRPGDERFLPDVDALLAELSELPDAPDLRLPPPAEYAPTGPYAAVELAGTCLHQILGNPAAPSTERRVAQLTQLIAAHPEPLTPVLDAYLSPSAPALGNRQTLMLLGALQGSPQGIELVRRCGYLHDELMVRTFPAVLPLAAAMLTTAGDHQRLRAALARLRTLLTNGGVEATRSSGVLDEPSVTALLAEVGGDEAHTLLAAADVESVPVRRSLHALITRRRLPLPERAVVLLVHPTQLRGGYLRALLRMSERGIDDDAVRRESGALLQAGLDEALLGRELSVLQPAIEALAVLPGTAARKQLRRLRHWRWWNLGSRARAIRHLARHASREPQQDGDRR